MSSESIGMLKLFYTILLSVATSGCLRASFAPGIPTTTDMKPSALTSKMTVSEPNVADGITAADITLEIRSAGNVPISGALMNIQSTGSQNVVVPCSASNANGISRCKLYSTKAEWKTVVAVGSIQLSKSTEFVAPSPSLSLFQFVSSGNAQVLPTGHKITSTSGIIEAPTVGLDIHGKRRVHTSVQGALFGN